MIFRRAAVPPVKIRIGKALTACLLLLATLPPSPAAPAVPTRLTVAVTDQSSRPMAGLNVSAKPLWGGTPRYSRTNASGLAVFNLPPGSYRFQAAYLGWSTCTRFFPVPATRRVGIIIPLKTVTVTVRATVGGGTLNLAGIPVLLRRAGNAVAVAGPMRTGPLGRAAFAVPQAGYFFEADYAGRAWASAAFIWSNRTISIPCGRLEATVLGRGASLAGVTARVLTAGGRDTGLHAVSDGGGGLSFLAPAGDYLLDLTLPDGRPWSSSFTISAGETVKLTVETSPGGEPVLSFLAAPAPVPGGADLVEVSVAAGDPDGDICRLRMEYSLDGNLWHQAVLQPGSLRNAYADDGAVPSVDNGRAFQIAGIPTGRGPNHLRFLWDASGQLPRADGLSVRLRLTLEDGVFRRTLSLGEDRWSGLGHDLSGGGLSATPGDSYNPSLAVDSRGRPHVAWIESFEDGEAVAYLRWDGLAWVDIDGQGRESYIVRRTRGWIYCLSLAVGPGDRPSLAWTGDESGRRRMYYLAERQGAWVGADGLPDSAGPVLESPLDPTSLQMKVDHLGRAHLLFTLREAQESALGYLRQAGGCWVDAGGRDQSRVFIERTPSNMGTSLALDDQGRPHVAWAVYDPSGGGTIRYLRLAGGAWLPPSGGDIPTSPGYGANPALVIEPGGGPIHVFWEQRDQGMTALLHATLEGNVWSLGEPVAPEARFPSPDALPGGGAAVAFIASGSGNSLPALMTGQGGWKPWPGLPTTVSAQAIGTCVANLAIPGTGGPLVAFEDLDGGALEIRCAQPFRAFLALDTSPPSAPGPLVVSGAPEANAIAVVFGPPAADANFAGYLIEVSPDPLFASAVLVRDGRDDACLASADFGGCLTTTVPGLPWGSEVYLRLTALDRSGHRASSPATGPVRVPEDRLPPALAVESPDDGLVTPEASLTLRGTTDDPLATVTVNGRPVEVREGFFSLEFPLAEGDNELLVAAVDEAGNESRRRLNIVSLPFSISTPRDGAGFRGNLARVGGSCGANVAYLTVKEYLASPAGGSFMFPLVDLAEGDNELAITARDGLGRACARRLRVNGLGGDYPLALRVEPGAGPVPLNVSMTAVAAAGLAGRLSWDADGDGRCEAEGEGLASMSPTFAEPGTYFPEVVLTDAAGASYRATATVRVHAQARVLSVLPLSRPAGLALDGDGYLFVVESGANRIVVFDAGLHPYATIGGGPEGPPLNQPTAAAADDAGNVWVCDTGNRRVATFTREGLLLSQFDAGTPPCRRIALVAGHLYLSAPDSAVLSAYEIPDDGFFAASPRFSASLAAPALGGTSGAAAMAAGEGGVVLLGDRSAGRLLTYHDAYSFGEESLAYGGPHGSFNGAASALSLSPRTGQLAVFDQASGRILVFDHRGSLLAVIGPDVFGQPGPSSPEGLALRQTREGLTVYLADTGNNRVVVVLLPGEDPLAPLDTLRRGLLTGDLGLVAEALHPFRRERHMAFFSRLGGRLAEAASWFEGVELVSLEGDLARCRLTRQTILGGAAGTFAFELLLIRDEKDSWKILDF